MQKVYATPLYSTESDNPPMLK